MRYSMRVVLSMLGLLFAVSACGVQIPLSMMSMSEPSVSTPPIINFRDYSAMGFSRTEDGVPVLGNPNAPITIVEFADFLCPHCQNFKTSTADRVIDELVATGQAKYEFRIFPVISQDSTYLGNLLECADTLAGDKAYWQAYDLLFTFVTNGDSAGVAGRNLATELGLNYAELLECTDSMNQIESNTELGRASGVAGTPSVFIRLGDGDLQHIDGGSFSVPTFEQIKAAVEAANG